MLAVLVLLPQIPATPAQAAMDIVYEREYLEQPLFNAAMKSAPGDFIEKTGDSVFNVTNRFTKANGGLSAPAVLSFGAEVSGCGYNAWYTFSFNTKERELAQKGDIAVAFSANLTNNEHWNFLNHWSTKLSYPHAILGSAPFSHMAWGKQLHDYVNSSNTSSSSVINGNYEFKPVGNTNGFETLGLHMNLKSEGCEDGETKVSAMAVMLADVQGPAVTEIYTTREEDHNSDVFTQFHAGEIIYIHLKFDEAIRFAEDAVTDNVRAMKLNVSMKRITNGAELGGIPAVADLVGLKNDTLTFKCTVPSTYTINGIMEPTNYYLDKVDYSNQSTWISLSPSFNLKIVYKKDGDTNRTVYPMSEKAIGHEMNKVTSLVVDLAGNGIDTVKSRTNLKDICYMDNLAPSVETVIINRIVKKSDNGTDRSEIFTSVGDKNGFWVKFNEGMVFISNNNYIPITDANVDKLSVQLNIRDSSGTPVEMQGSKAGPDGRSFYFEYTIQADDEPLVYDAAGDQAIGVNRIYSTDPAFVLADSRGNLYNEDTQLINRGSGRIMPEQQLWLDVTPPTVIAGVEQNHDGAYTPLPESAGSREFYFPIVISDVTGPGGGDYVSGTNGLKGVFRWKNEVNNPNRDTYQFEYYIGKVTVPANAVYKSASTWEDIPITQIDGGQGNVIHIRLSSGMDYSLVDTELVIKPLDYAGNTAEVRFPLDYAYDNIGPRIKLESYSTTFDSTNQIGKITADINIKDVEEKVDSIWFQWVDDNGEPGENGWTQIINYNTGDAGSKSFKIEKDGLVSEVYHRYDLYIRTLNRNGTVTVELFDFDCDFRKPEFKLEFITDPGDVLPKHSVIFKELDSEKATSIIMIKREGTENEYWVKNALMTTDADSGNPFVIDDIFGIPTTDVIMAESVNSPDIQPSDYFAYWRRCTVSEDVYNSITIDQLVDLGDYWGDVDLFMNDGQVELSGLFNNTYGKIDVRLIVAYKTDLQLNNGGLQLIIPNTANYVDMNYSFNFICGTGLYDNVHSITITPMTDDGMPESNDHLAMGMNPDYTLEGLLDNKPQVLRSFGGNNLRIDIANIKAPDYGIADVDFDSEYTYFELVYDEYYGNCVYKTPLKAATSQVVQIPAGVDLSTGKYFLQVSVDRKSVDGADSIDYGLMLTPVWIDRSTINSYGVKAIESNINIGGISVPVKTEYQLSPGVRPNEIFLSTEVPSTVYLEADYTPLLFWHEHIWDPDEERSVDVLYITHAYVKVWNKADPSKSSEWKELVYKIPHLEYGTEGLLIDGPGVYAFSSDELIALLDGESSGDLCYQFMVSSADKKMTVDESGNLVTEYIPYTTPVQILTVRTSGENPTFDMTYTVDPDTGDIKTAVARLESVHSVPEELNLLYLKDGETTTTAFTQGTEPDITESGTYYFAAYDKYHNYTVVSQTLEIDRTAPFLTVNNTSTGNMFAFTAEITDKNADGLVISFDDSYNSLLGFEKVDGKNMEFKVPEADAGGDSEWRTTGASDSGILRTVTQTAEGKKTITVEGVFKYDETAGNGATIPRTVILYAFDTFGNKSSEQSLSISAVNTKPAYTAGVYDTTDGFKATFTTPVILTDPTESASTPVYEPVKTHLPIYNNGDYTIRFTDIFGTDYSQDITVTAYDGLYDVRIAISETGPTNQDVVVTLDASGINGVTLDLPVDSGNMTVEPVLVGGGIKGAVIAVKENREFSFDIVPTDSNIPSVTRTISITNIDRTAPTAELVWVFSADVDDNGQTKGDVTVSLWSDETIRPINGKATMHTFTLHDQEDYTFEYTDAAGNPGPPITASLSGLSPAVTIVEKTLQESDTTPPDYEMAIYITSSGSFVRTGEYTRTGYEAAASGNPFDDPVYATGAMKLDFAIKDINQTKMLLFNGIKTEAELAGIGYDSAGDAIAGITLGGNAVYIRANASFTIVIADARNNITLVPVVITRIDDIPPTGDIQYEPVGFYAIRAYIFLRDNMPGTVRMLTTTGVEWDGAKAWSIETESGPVTGTGAYYHEFDTNGSFTFTFADEAGNIGTATAEVTTMDETRPQVTKVSWSPCLAGSDTDDDGYADQPPAQPVNTDIMAYVTFNKNVRTVTAALIDEDGNRLAGTPEDYYILKYGVASATVTFKQGARVRLTFAALNGAANTYILEVADVIDRQAPVITITSDEPAGGAVKSVNLTFGSNEPAHYMGNGAELKLNEENGKYEYGVALRENGTYRFSFVDKAGNIAEVQYTASKIDNTAPVINVTGIPETKAQVQAWNSDPANAGNPKTHTSTKEPITFQVMVNEAGKLTFGGETTDIHAGVPVTLSVNASGYYGISAKDEAGNTAYVSFLVDRIDTSPPVIIFERSVMKVKQETPLAEFEAAALADAIVSDNYDTDMTGRYFLTVSLTQQQLNTPGTYRIEYTAADSAGNTKTVERTVNVYDKTQPTILINSIKADDGGTLFFTADTINIAVELLDAGNGTEPFKLYYAAGMKTAGQMKTAGKLLTVTGGQSAFTAAEEGFYTIYLVTQSRKTFITYLYVQK